MEKEILINDYWYELPEERIALYPLPQRDHSKLLVYRNGEITHSEFRKIAEFLPEKCSLFLNNTKVIPARLYFQKQTGATIELFLLHPVLPSTLVVQTMEATGSCQWECAIGNLKKWNEGTTLCKKSDELSIEAELVDREKGIVKFTWHPAELTFAEIIVKSGITPLPPYLKREAEESDKERYQTVYSQNHGAVAAPTAGLHFTDSLLQDLNEKGHPIEYVTLHVSAGTFQPVKTENALEHKMHQEQMVVTRQNIEALLHTNKIVAVGTTSMRTLESLYWYGVMLSLNPSADFNIPQHAPYEMDNNLSKNEAMRYVLQRMEQLDTNTLYGETSIYIVPGYQFKMVDALITNFHQPGSTLMLLVAAFIGPDWKNVYQEALGNQYRFLSYGDSSLLFRNEKLSVLGF